MVDKFVDIYNDLLVYFNTAQTSLIFEDVLTGDNIATVAMVNPPVWAHIAASTGEVLVADTAGNLFVYDLTGILIETVTGWGIRRRWAIRPAFSAKFRSISSSAVALI